MDISQTSYQKIDKKIFELKQTILETLVSLTISVNDIRNKAEIANKKVQGAKNGRTKRKSSIRKRSI